MKLYYSPGACSLSPNIVLREAGVAFDLERVDTSTKKTETNADFLQINPKGYVPVLRLDDGENLTEGAAIVQYVADQRPDSGLAKKLEPLSVPACRSISISQHLSCTRPSARCSHPTRAKRASRLPSPMSSASSNILSVFSRTSGQAAAAPPKNVMNSRRLISCLTRSRRQYNGSGEPFGRG